MPEQKTRIENAANQTKHPIAANVQRNSHTCDVSYHYRDIIGSSVNEGHLPESWFGEFEQRDKWSFCLRAARMAGEQEKR
jgi:hypothetical protein